MRGKVKWFDHAKGFGFITPDDGGKEAFVHESELLPNELFALRDGDEVEFNTIAGNLGPAAVGVRRVSASSAGESAPTPPAGQVAPPEESPAERMLVSLRDHERAVLGLDLMTEQQKQVLADWGLRMFSLGQHRVADIEAVKYEGRLIILDDGSRWAVDASDTFTAEGWSPFERVVVIDDQMFRLDEVEAIHVEEEFE